MLDWRTDAFAMAPRVRGKKAAAAPSSSDAPADAVVDASQLPSGQLTEFSLDLS